MNLYFIGYSNGDNRDAIIEAESPKHAEAIWRVEFEMEDGDVPDVCLIRPTGQARMIPWHELLGGTT